MLDAIGIVSGSIEKSSAFYKVFDLYFKQSGGPDHFEAVSEKGLRIMLDTVELIKKINPSWKKHPNQNMVLCFKQSSSQDVDQKYQACLEQHGKSIKEPWDAFWGQRYASVQDPDGNQIDIFADLTD